ncbi:MAG: nucleotidyltransferase domain-containing protein [Bacillota bacterium]
MRTSICSILRGYSPTLYLLGSVALNDFRPGWSDIDLLCLTEQSLSDEHAEELLNLRQKLVQETSEPIYRLFECGFLSVRALHTHTPDTVVYWGTSGQRLTDQYHFDSFCMVQMQTTGRLLCGEDIRTQFPMPSYTDLRNDVIRHYQTIRKYAAQTDGSLYACAWLLDIARCLYTLKTGGVIAKTAAGEWALVQRLCNVPDTLAKTIEVRSAC